MRQIHEWNQSLLTLRVHCKRVQSRDSRDYLDNSLGHRITLLPLAQGRRLCCTR